MSSTTEHKLILLDEWGKARFNPPPSPWTLRAMVRAGKIDPPPVKVGKAYYVETEARVVDPNRRPSLVDRLRRTA